MPQNEQFDILGELAATAAHEQPQERREDEIPEREEHPPMLPDLDPDDTPRKPKPLPQIPQKPGPSAPTPSAPVDEPSALLPPQMGETKPGGEGPGNVIPG